MFDLCHGEGARVRVGEPALQSRVIGVGHGVSVFFALRSKGPRPWFGAFAGVPWQFLWAPPMPNFVFRFATVSGQNIQWFLRRNCSVSPAQLGGLYLSLCLVSLGIGAVFWSQGAVLVMPFVGLELVAVGVAFWVFARHASDGERISLEGSRLVVELESGGRLQRAEFNRDWVRVEPKNGGRSLIQLSAQGRSVEVGRYVLPELRSALAREIRMALRHA